MSALVTPEQRAAFERRYPGLRVLRGLLFEPVAHQPASDAIPGDISHIAPLVEIAAGRTAGIADAGETGARPSEGGAYATIESPDEQRPAVETGADERPVDDRAGDDSAPTDPATDPDPDIADLIADHGDSLFPSFRPLPPQDRGFARDGR